MAQPQQPRKLTSQGPFGRATGRPQRRTEKLVVRKVSEEVLVYDLKRDRALCLNQVASQVWDKCNGKSSPREIAAALNLDEQIVWCALDQLGKDRLLDSEMPMPPALAGLTRRQQLRALAAIGAVALPTVMAITAPSAAEAATCKKSNATCTTSAQCCSGICAGGKCV